MPPGPYRRVLAVRQARRALLLGILIRIPMFGMPVALTLHVTATLHRSYGSAGLLVAATTMCIAISGPWRGRLLDRVGLRRVVLPGVVLQVLFWTVAPFHGYWLLLGLASFADLFRVPTFGAIRQSLIAALPDADRRGGLALDSMGVEVSFMVGPLVGAWAATTWSTPRVLCALAMADAAASMLLWVANPPLRRGSDRVHRSGHAWVSGGFVGLCAAAAAATIVLSGTDIAVVALLRHLGQTSTIGIVMAVWGLGSFAGGLVYGLLHRPISAYLLLAGLAAGTAPLALSPSGWAVSALVFVAGLFCAPAITASLDQVSALVPESVRGEALGWHGSAMTVGSALGGPVAGLAIDAAGPGAGFLTMAAAGLAVAAVGWVTPSRPALGGDGLTEDGLVAGRVG